MWKQAAGFEVGAAAVVSAGVLVVAAACVSACAQEEVGEACHKAERVRTIKCVRC